RDEYFDTHIADHDAVRNVVWNLGRVVFIFGYTHSALGLVAVAAHRYEPAVAPCFLGAARLHVYLRNDPKFIAVIVGVLWAHRVMALSVWVRRTETRIATARVLSGHWLPSQMRALLVQVPDQPARVIHSLRGVHAFLESLAGVVG